MPEHDTQSKMLTHALVRLYNDVSCINLQIQKVHDDINALVQSHQITQEDADFILSKVPLSTQPASIEHDEDEDDNQKAGERLPKSATDSPESDYLATPPSFSTKRAVPPGVPTMFKSARALWDYNLEREQPNDLSFARGDVIENVAQLNKDWWTGSVQGRTGYFPSNYVEVIVSSMPPYSASTKAPAFVPYRTTNGAMSLKSEDGHNAIGLREHLPEDNGKTNGVPNVAHGLGFGAGSAVGGKLVRAIF